mmetsp:Transcript_16460/g.55368  ORF Transcript_16460/g.55368 Transcript_16460/m.55368 type:complete len:303 (+) Transcript_16460:658-1566(+)
MFSGVASNTVAIIFVYSRSRHLGGKEPLVRIGKKAQFLRRCVPQEALQDLEGPHCSHRVGAPSRGVHVWPHITGFVRASFQVELDALPVAGPFPQSMISSQICLHLGRREALPQIVPTPPPRLDGVGPLVIRKFVIRPIGLPENGPLCKLGPRLSPRAVPVKHLIAADRIVILAVELVMPGALPPDPTVGIGGSIGRRCKREDVRVSAKGPFVIQTCHEVQVSNADCMVVDRRKRMPLQLEAQAAKRLGRTAKPRQAQHAVAALHADKVVLPEFHCLDGPPKMLARHAQTNCVARPSEASEV